jgi:ABC-type ATPase with predicted acetyltransferase domain
MIFNCLNCGISISTNKNNCPYCKTDNVEAIEMLMGTGKKEDKELWRERVKGSILSYVLR